VKSQLFACDKDIDVKMNLVWQVSCKLWSKKSWFLFPCKHAVLEN